MSIRGASAIFVTALALLTVLFLSSCGGSTASTGQDSAAAEVSAYPSAVKAETATPEPKKSPKAKKTPKAKATKTHKPTPKPTPKPTWKTILTESGPHGSNRNETRSSTFKIGRGAARVIWDISPTSGSSMCSMVLIPKGGSVNNSPNALWIVSPDLGDSDSGTAKLSVGSVNDARHKLKPGSYFLFVMSGNCTWDVTIDQQEH